MKKVLATVLALVMALGVTTYAWADESVTTPDALVTAVKAGGEVKLGADIEASITIPADKTVRIDLNGKTLTGSIVNKGKLTVTGTGRVVATAAGTAAVANFPGGTVTLSGGTYESANWYVIKNMGEMYINGLVNVQKPDGSTDTSSLIDNGWVNGSDMVAGEAVAAQANKAKLFISSGTFTGKSGAKSCSVVKNDDYGELEISGGTFDSTANNGTDNATTLLNWNIARISGGIFKGMYPISNGAYNNDADKGQITITGGEFIGTSTIFGNGQGGDGKGSVTVSGGTFTAPALGAGYEDVPGGYTLTVSGGTFKDINGGKVDVSKYLERGKQQNADGSVGNKSTGGGYYYAGPSISAVLNGSNKSATDYTSGDYGLIFRSTASYSGFQGVQVDGKALAKGNYTVEDNGGTEVYLKAVYLKTLAAGKHTVTILSSAGNTSMDFTIGGKTTAPQTFDAGIALYVGMALTSAAGAAFAVKKRED